MRDAIAVLEDALARCLYRDMRGCEVEAALAFLAARAPEACPVRNFAGAPECADPSARRRNANAALNAIRRRFTL